MGGRTGGRGRELPPWPKVTRALLIGGDAGGWVIPVRGGPALSASILVTMEAGWAQEIYDVRRDEPVRKQADGHWLYYNRLANLPPDGFGRVAYWFGGREDEDPEAVPVLALQNYRASTELRLAKAREEQRWPIVEGTLSRIGHELILDGPEIELD